MNRMKTLWSVLGALAILTTGNTFAAHHESGEKAKINPTRSETDPNRVARRAQKKEKDGLINACWLKANSMTVGQWAGSGHWMGPNNQQTFSGTFTIKETSPGNFKLNGTNAAGQAQETTWGVSNGKYKRNGNPFAVTHCSDHGSYMLVVQRSRNEAFALVYTGAYKQDAVMHVTQGRPIGTDIPFGPFFSRLDTRVK